MNAPPGLLEPSPTANYVHENPGYTGVQSNLSSQSLGQQGTLISDAGIVSVNMVVDNPNIPFRACNDAVRFLRALYPTWSTPAFVGGVAMPNQVGATYSIEKQEKKVLDNYDGAQDEINLKRKVIAVIKEILDEPTVKRIHFKVDTRLTSEVYRDPFPATTYIVVEVKPYAQERGKYIFSVKFDGGPPEVEVSSCCCFTSPSSLHKKEEAADMKPAIYQQADSVLTYVKNYHPDDPIARQVTAHNNMIRGSSFEEDSFLAGGSKVSKGSKGSGSRLRHMRNNSKSNYPSTIVSGTSQADEIKKLYDLFKLGALSKGEFELEKQKILNPNGSQVTRPPPGGKTAPPGIPAPPDSFF